MLKISVNVTYQGSPAATRKELRAAVRRALEAIGTAWHRDTLPEHFTPRAATKYGYHKRERGYMIRKARVKHHQKPLVWSGALERAATGRAEIRTAARGGLKVTMRGLRALNFSNRAIRSGANYPNLAEELIATTEAERQDMAEELDRRVTRDLMQVRGAAA